MKFFVIFLTLILASNSAAADDRSFRFGVMPMFSNFSVVDNPWSTAPNNNFSVISGVMFTDIGRDARLMAHAGIDKFSIPASTTNIGEDVSRGGGDISYQTLLRISRTWKPWLGFGIGEASESFKNRYTVTAGGFGNPVTPSEKTVNNVFLLLNTSTEWDVNKNWTAGMHIQYEQPTGEGSKAIRLGFYLIY